MVKNGQTLEIFEGRTNVTCIRSEVLNKKRHQGCFAGFDLSDSECCGVGH